MKKILQTLKAISKLTISCIIITGNINADMIDEAYIYAKISHDSKSNKQLRGKVSVKKTFDINDDALIFANLAATTEYNYDTKKTHINGEVRELYYDDNYLHELFNLRAGRSIKTFDYTKTYSIVDFFSKSNQIDDINDRELKTKPMDGFSFALNDITLEGSGKSQSITLHAYTKNLTKEGNNKYKLVLEATQSQDSHYQSIFLFTDYAHNSGIALASSRNIKDSFIFKATLKYTNTNKTKLFEKIDSVVGLEYSPTSRFLLGLEHIYLGGRIDNAKDREKINQNFKSKNEAQEFYSDLTSNNYLSFYTNYKPSFLDTSFTLSVFRNLGDSSNRYSISADYNIDSFEFSLYMNAFDGDKNSEFGYLNKNAYSYKTSFLISYLFN